MSAVKPCPLLPHHSPSLVQRGLQVTICPPQAPQRQYLESFVSEVFYRHYQAHIKAFYPYLLSITTPDHILRAVAGIRSAKNSVLFSEHYLNHSIEHYTNHTFSFTSTREQIVEVGNLAPANVGQMRWLITALTAFLYAANFKVVVFTGILPVFNAFQRMGLPLIDLEAATLDKLPVQLRKQWTPKYYQHHPKVYIGDITLGVKKLHQNIRQHNPTLIPIWELAWEQGNQFAQNTAL